MTNFLKIIVTIITAFLLFGCQFGSQGLLPQEQVNSTDSAYQTSGVDVVNRDGLVLYEIPSGLVTYNFSFDQNGSLWIGLTNKILVWKPNISSYTEFSFDSNFEGRDLLVSNSGDVWVGSSNSYLQQHHNDKWYEHNYGSPFITTETGIIWASGYKVKTGACIYRYELATWSEFCPPIDGNSRVFDIAVGPDNLLWVSFSTSDYASNRGVWRFNGENWELVNELSSSNWPVYHLASNPDINILWAVGSSNLSSNETGFVKKYDGENWSTVVNSEPIFDVKISPDNLLWARSLGYLLRFDNSSWTKVDPIVQLNRIFEKEFNLYSFGFNPSGMLCVGTDKGVACENSLNFFSNK